MDKTVTVIGAGIVGVCCALHLQREGFKVRLVEKGEPGRAASFGNSGSFGTASCVPFAMPGVLKKVPRMLFDPDSPLKLRWSHVPKALPWFLRFIEAARPSRVEAIAAARNSLLVHTHAGYAPLIEGADAGPMGQRPGPDDDLRERGRLRGRRLRARSPAPARRAHGHPRRQRGAADGAGAVGQGHQGGVAARRPPHHRSLPPDLGAGRRPGAPRRRDRERRRARLRDRQRRADADPDRSRSAAGRDRGHRRRRLVASARGPARHRRCRSRPSAAIT